MDLGGLVPKKNNIENSIHSDEEQCDEPKKKKKGKQVKKSKVQIKQESEGSIDEEN